VAGFAGDFEDHAVGEAELWLLSVQAERGRRDVGVLNHELAMVEELASATCSVDGHCRLLKRT